MGKSRDILDSEAEIREIHVRYCRAADRVDEALFRTCFHPDAYFEFPIYQGPLEGFVGMAWDFLRNYQLTRHFIGNQLVRVNGDAAWAEHYTLATHFARPDVDGQIHDFIAHARYIDQLERRDEWRIVRRSFVMDMSETKTVVQPDGAPRVTDGRRDLSDPSYEKY